MKLVLTSLLLVVTTLSFGQTVHFTQFNKTPMLINPGLTGTGKGFNRFHLNYRTQWTTIDNPFSTAAFSYDMALVGKRSKVSQGSYIGIGVDIFNDIAGVGRLVTNQYALSTSIVLRLNKENFLSLGMRGAFEQKSIKDIDAYSWDNQWNGTAYDPSLPSNESFGGLAFNRFDFSTGLAWKYQENSYRITTFDRNSATAGIAIMSLNTNRSSFYNNFEDDVYAKWVFHASGKFNINDLFITFNPQILFTKQGPQNEFLIGSVFRYHIVEETKYTGYVNEKSFGLGIHVRAKDAIIFSILYEVGGFEVGLSYDNTISNLQYSNKSFGAAEISLRWCDLYGRLFRQGTMHINQ